MTRTTGHMTGPRRLLLSGRWLAVGAVIVVGSTGCGAAVAASSTKTTSRTPTVSPPVTHAATIGNATPPTTLPPAPTTAATVAAPVDTSPSVTFSCVITSSVMVPDTFDTAVGQQDTTYTLTITPTNTYALLVTGFDVSFFDGATEDGTDSQPDVTPTLLEPNAPLTFTTPDVHSGSPNDSCVVQDIDVTAPGGDTLTLNNADQP